MNGRDFSHRLVLAVAFGLLVFLWSGLLGQSHLAGRASFLDRIEASFLDLRFLLAGPRPAPQDLLIVALDDDTVREVGRFPLPRPVVARLVQDLSRLQAKAIAADILFIDPGAPGEDDALAKALKDSHAIIAAAGLFRVPGPAGVSAGDGVPVAERIIWPIETLRDRTSIGLVNVTTDNTGTPRHVPLLVRSEDGLLPSFALRTVTRARGVDATIEDDRVEIGPTTVRADLGLNLPLRFYGPRGSIPTVSARSLLKGEVPAETVAGRIVVLGATAIGTGDTFTTPFDSVLPGVEVLATAIGQLMTGDGLVRDRAIRQLDVAAAVGLSLAAILLICFVPLGSALAATAALAAAWLVFTAVAFSHGYWFSAVLPIATAAVPAVFCAAGRQMLDRRQTRRFADAEEALRRFQSPALADRIVRDPTFLDKPVQQTAPILFIDLSNFTRMSERLGPVRTRDMLREFHGVVEAEVTQQGGLVLSFMGDGAMIAFGLPEPRPDDATRAVKAGIGLATGVRKWIADRSADWPQDLARNLDVRVGAHQGPVVISRLGTETHQHITATGDSVNVTSRLLDVAAREGAPLVVSIELLKAAVPGIDTSAFGSTHEIHIRGREQPLTIATWSPGDGNSGRAAS